MTARTVFQKAKRSVIHSIQMTEQLKSDRIWIENDICDFEDAASSLFFASAACRMIDYDCGDQIALDHCRLRNEIDQMKKKLVHIDARLDHHRKNAALFKVMISFAEINSDHAENLMVRLKTKAARVPA